MPGLKRNVFKACADAADTRVVEDDVSSAKRVFNFCEQRRHGLWIAHVGGHRQRTACSCLLSDNIQRLLPPPGQHHAVAFAEKSQRNGFADSGTCAGDESDFRSCCHENLSIWSNYKLCRIAHVNYFQAVLEITDTTGFSAVLPLQV